MPRRTLWLAIASLLLGACGGGGGGGSGPSVQFLTADPRGMTSSAAPAPGAAGGASALDAAAGASDAAGEIAREVQEADLYRVDGDLLVLVNAWRGLAIVDLAAVRVTGRLATQGVPQEMYLRGGRAFVLLQGFDGAGSLLDVSLADPSAPTLRASFPLGGSLRASRLVGDVLYAVTEAAVRSFLVGADLTPVGTAALAGGAAFVHATDSLLAVAAPGDGVSTQVTLVDISDPAGAVATRGSLTLPGFLGDEQKLHVGAGTLRVVTHDPVDRGLSRLFTVSLGDLDAPAVLGTLSLARGEQLFATRFTDTAAYLVTFEQVDPLWVVDLSDPVHPRIAGSLTVPGWSTQLVALPGRLVAVGVDPADGWHVIASLFDVSNPAAPSLLDREDFGWGWSQAFTDVKALGVFPAEGRVLLPLSGEADRVAVLDLGATTLTLRGTIDLEGTALRGFPHPRGLVAVSTEEVVVVDPATLVARGRATVAENVVDAVRLPDGRLLSLVARRASGRLGDVALPMVPDRCFPVGATVAVTGWDATGRAAYVVDFGPASPTLSARLDLGGATYAIDAPAMGMERPDMWSWYGGLDAALSPAGRLVVRGQPGMTGGFPGGPVTPLGTMGGGASGMPGGGTTGPTGTTDGFVVVDVPHARLDAPIEIADGTVSGFVLDGETLVYTLGSFVDADSAGRPWMRHDLVRLDLASRVATAPANVPGYLVASVGGVDTTVEETWGADWTYTTSVVASEPSATVGGDAVVLARRALPEGAFDLRRAGATLFFTTWTGGIGIGMGGGTVGGGVVPPMSTDRPAWSDPSGPYAPQTSIGTVRLEAGLPLGPTIDATQGFATLLLPEDGAALLVRDGVTLERWDVSGATATKAFAVGVGTYPLTARADATPGAYLVALGFGGLVTVP